MQILKIAASNTVVNFVMQPWACSVREMFNPDTVPDTQALGSFNVAWPRELCSVQNEQRGRICPLGRAQKTVSQFRIYKEVEVYSKAVVFNQLKQQNHFPNKTLPECKRYKIGHWELLRTVWRPLLWNTLRKLCKTFSMRAFSFSSFLPCTNLDKR